MFWFLTISTILLGLVYLITNRNVSRFPYLKPLNGNADLSGLPKISVIIPMYNENKNAEACLRAILSNTRLDTEQLEVIVVDDRSIDNTLEILRSLDKNLNDSRLKIIEGKDRPKDRKWVGKNWACWQGAEAATGEYILFVDADVRLKKASIESALSNAIDEKADLLTMAPLLKFGFLGERLIQPIIFSNVLVVLDPSVVNKSGNKMYFAIGPFMLFKASTYRELGGHKEISAEVLDDVTLAKQVKLSGHNLKVFNGKDLADLTMYDSWNGIIEGWSKNYYQALQGNLLVVCVILFLTLFINFLPWLNVIFSVINLDLAGIAIGILGVLLLYLIRYSLFRTLGFEIKYWWLSWVGSLILCYIIISSVYKTFTGKNWTWKGRNLE